VESRAGTHSDRAGLTIALGAHVAALSKAMLDRRVHTVPVVDGGLLVGVVSRRDLLRLIVRDDELVAKDVRHHLSLLGGVAWWVGVVDGVATLSSESADETERHVATVVGHEQEPLHQSQPAGRRGVQAS